MKPVWVYVGQQAASFLEWDGLYCGGGGCLLLLLLWGPGRPGADGRLLTFWVVKQVFQWGPRDMGPLDTLLSDL